MYNIDCLRPKPPGKPASQKSPAAIGSSIPMARSMYTRKNQLQHKLAIQPKGSLCAAFRSLFLLMVCALAPGHSRMFRDQSYSLVWFRVCLFMIELQNFGQQLLTCSTSFRTARQ